MHTDIRSAIDNNSMSPFQVVAVVNCLMLNMLDGFDVLAERFRVVIDRSEVR